MTDCDAVGMSSMAAAWSGELAGMEIPPGRNENTRRPGERNHRVRRLKAMAVKHWGR
jgi:hypothetical protein